MNDESWYAIDPGVTDGCAVVIMCAGRTVGREFVKPDRATTWVRLERAIVERPEYQGERSMNAAVQVLQALSWCGAAVAYALAERVIEVTPTQWKGQTPKPVTHARLWPKLTETERKFFGGESTEHMIETACRKGALDRWQPGKTYYPERFKMHNFLDARAIAQFAIEKGLIT